MYSLFSNPTKDTANTTRYTMIKLALFSLFCLQAALAAPNWGLKEGLIEEYGEVRYELQY